MNDYNGLYQASAAKMVNVSRQTFGRVLVDARYIVADALFMGKTFRIEGGHFEMPSKGRSRWFRGGRL